MRLRQGYCQPAAILSLSRGFSDAGKLSMRHLGQLRLLPAPLIYEERFLQPASNFQNFYFTIIAINHDRDQIQRPGSPCLEGQSNPHHRQASSLPNMSVDQNELTISLLRWLIRHWTSDRLHGSRIWSKSRYGRPEPPSSEYHGARKLHLRPAQRDILDGAIRHLRESILAARQNRPRLRQRRYTSTHALHSNLH